MQVITVNETDRFKLSSTSKGDQIKWLKDNLYIKADTRGYEGISEALVSELLDYIKSDYGFADYFICTIKENTDEYRGCYSKNFLQDGESLVSVQRILDSYVPDMSKFFRDYSGKDLLENTLSILNSATGLDCYDYFRFIIYLDALVLNEDRHFNNICFIYNRDKKFYSFAPVFDNGLSLLSDTDDYQHGMNLSSLIKKVRSKPFSRDFKKQVDYFDKRLLKIDFKGFQNSLKLNSGVFNNRDFIRARQVILMRLRATEGYLWEQS